MDRRLALHSPLAIPSGHRLDVTEQIDETTGESSVLSIVDLDTGIRYRRVEELHGEIVRWTGRVLECTVTFGGPGAHTILRVDADVEAGVAGATGARAALHGADAAVDAAKAEADRWGGGDRLPEPEPERFW